MSISIAEQDDVLGTVMGSQLQGSGGGGSGGKKPDRVPDINYVSNQKIWLKSHRGCNNKLLLYW